MFVIEGTPDEISDVMAKMPSDSGSIYSEKPMQQSSKPKNLLKNEGGPSVFVTEAFARRVLTRLKLSEPMKKVLEGLLEANGEWVEGSKLHEISGYAPAQFAGLMGAFGRRMAHTHGYDEEAHFWDWRESEDGWDYRLPESVVTVLREGDIL